MALNANVPLTSRSMLVRRLENLPSKGISGKVSRYDNDMIPGKRSRFPCRHSILCSIVPPVGLLAPQRMHLAILQSDLCSPLDWHCRHLSASLQSTAWFATYDGTLVLKPHSRHVSSFSTCLVKYLIRSFSKSLALHLCCLRFCVLLIVDCVSLTSGFMTKTQTFHQKTDNRLYMDNKMP